MKKIALVFMGLLLFLTHAIAQQVVATVPSSRISNNLSSTIAVTNTFQSLWAQNSARAGCTIQNNGSNTQWIFFGPIANATKAKSAILAPGQSLNCATSGISATDQVSLTGTNGDAFFAVADGSPAIQSVGGAAGGGSAAITAQATTTAPTYINNTANPVSQDLSGNSRTIVGGSLPAGANLIGSIGIRNGSAATPADGLANANVAPNTVDNAGTSRFGYQNFGYDFNGTTWDRKRGDVNGSWVIPTPTAVAGNALTPVVTSAVAGSIVVKGSAGNLYGWEVTSGASAGYVMVFNATAAPADGAVTPIKCYTLAANSTMGIGYDPVPIVFSTGITLVFSTTGCFTKTISATAFMSGDAK